jgi:hypothetical protein
MIEMVMQNAHHGNHEPALAAKIEKTYIGNIDNKINLGGTSATDPVDAA